MTDKPSSDPINGSNKQPIVAVFVNEQLLDVTSVRLATDLQDIPRPGAMPDRDFVYNKWEVFAGICEVLETLNNRLADPERHTERRITRDLLVRVSGEDELPDLATYVIVYSAFVGYIPG